MIKSPTFVGDYFFIHTHTNLEVKKVNKKRKNCKQNSNLPLSDSPETAEEMVNRYGTYEIQSTAATDNQYPCIAQGFNKKQIKHDCENPHDD